MDDYPQCETCGARFYYPAKLAEHANVHSGTTPFRCEHDGCEEAFPTRDRLRTHAQKQARPISHWFPYDRVRVVNADP